MLYDIETIKSLSTGIDDFYFVSSRFRQAREWFTKNAERCRASYDPAKSGPEVTSDRGMANARFQKWEYVQGIFIYKNHNGWYADVLLCDGQDVRVFGTAMDDPCKSRCEAHLRAEGILHTVLNYETGRGKDSRKASRYDWRAIWRTVIATLQSLSDNASYPKRILMCMDVLDNKNDHQFLLNIYSCVPMHLIAGALEEWESRIQNGGEFSCLSRNWEGRDTCGIAVFGFDNTCFILICDFTDANVPVLHLRTYNAHEHAAGMEDVIESLKDEFPFLRNAN